MLVSRFQAREDTVASFRRMLDAGDLDDREIYIDVPVKEGWWRFVEYPPT